MKNEIALKILENSIADSSGIDKDFLKEKIRHCYACIELAKKYLDFFSISLRENLLNCVILHDVGRFSCKEQRLHGAVGKQYLEKIDGIPAICKEVAEQHSKFEKWDNIYNLFTKDIDCLENLMQISRDGVFEDGIDGDASDEVKEQIKSGMVLRELCKTKGDWIYYYNSWIDWNFSFEFIRKEAEKYRIA